MTPDDYMAHFDTAIVHHIGLMGPDPDLNQAWLHQEYSSHPLVTLTPEVLLSIGPLNLMYHVITHPAMLSDMDGVIYISPSSTIDTTAISLVSHFTTAPVVIVLWSSTGARLLGNTLDEPVTIQDILPHLLQPDELSLALDGRLGLV